MRLSSPITTVQCSICSPLNTKPRVVVTDFRLHHTAIIYGFTKWWLLEAHLQHTPRHIIIRVCTNTPT